MKLLLKCVIFSTGLLQLAGNIERMGRNNFKSKIKARIKRDLRNENWKIKIQSRLFCSFLQDAVLFWCTLILVLTDFWRYYWKKPWKTKQKSRSVGPCVKKTLSNQNLKNSRKRIRRPWSNLYLLTISKEKTWKWRNVELHILIWQEK